MDSSDLNGMAPSGEGADGAISTAIDGVDGTENRMEAAGCNLLVPAITPTDYEE